ncbi:MAG: hypothetical protein IBX57_00320 [Gammaproteobacteria bacterium]|nr:hypothetical protein [Gammaproteobacteria bacterium]
MLAELELYIREVTTEGNQQVITQACESLEKLGVVEHEDEILNLMSTKENLDSQSFILNIFNILTSYLSDSINAFGIELEDENVNLKGLTYILKGLLTLPDYGDPFSVQTILMKERSCTEKLVDILGEVHSEPWYFFAPLISTVSEELVFRVEKIIEKNIGEEEEPHDLSIYRERFKIHKEGKGLLKAEELIQEGIRLKTPICYIQELTDDYLNTLSKNDVKLAVEIKGLVLISDTADDKVTAKVRELLEYYAEDINVLTKALMFIGEG